MSKTIPKSPENPIHRFYPKPMSSKNFTRIISCDLLLNYSTAKDRQTERPGKIL